MQVELAHDFRFESAHRLLNVPEDHKCARLHGHSYRVEVVVRGPVDEQSGWLVDYQALVDAWQPLHELLDHRYLNDVEGLGNPTSENLARFIWTELQPALPELYRITIQETCEARCTFYGKD
ncbi:MAG: 6-carboxytetrahydropterin synthase QueD [Deltaproteobacteria bacterium]|jgi:6-pyruvoyltetrahydropterin/6-carboxytetrahydropterin synthase|nr:6-carboxytetrahydropterin synthase QueD [Deltaproteobacteria bacterium]MBW2530904.1 6-carboxytetrahydropterin synthase QueD [Deltaproteobacteria bacterium]